MRNEIKKYHIENLGSFTLLDDKELNDLCSYDLPLIQVPGVLYMNPGYEYAGNGILLSHKELKSILQSTTDYLFN